MAKIIIDVSPDGDSTIKVEGAKGRECQKLTAGFEAVLGLTVKDVKTAEFYQAAVVAQTVKAGR